MKNRYLNIGLKSTWNWPGWLQSLQPYEMGILISFWDTGKLGTGRVK